MNNMILTKFSKLLSLSILFSFTATLSYGQLGSQTVSDSSMVIVLFACVMILILFLASILGDKIIKLASSKFGVASDKRIGLIPTLNEIAPNNDKFVDGDTNKKVIHLKKGFDIKTIGAAKRVLKNYSSETYAIKPSDFVGLQPIPKMMVKIGDTVKAGDKLFYDKGFEGVFFTSPVSGEIIEIKRAEKRAIAEIIIKADGKNEFVPFKKADPKSMSKEEVISQLTESGAWTFMTERPFGVVASVENTPKSIHISTFDTAPLAVDYAFVFKNIDAKDFQAGLDALAQITNQVNLNIDASKSTAALFDNATGVQKNYFNGAHPAGNVGIQIHHTDGVQKGDFIYTIKAEDVANVGKLFTKGIYEPTRIVALAGPVVKQPHYVKTIQGANIEQLVAGNLEEDHSRVISGNILTGKQIHKNGFLGFFDNQICAIEEGDHHEMFGWILPQYARPSLSPTFPWKMIDFVKFNVNTNTHGEKRAFVVSGQYEEVLPMDLYPQHLMKAIIKNEFEEMEGLGIYELIEEDIALCEFACTSKQPLQNILREGLDYIRSQS